MNRYLCDDGNAEIEIRAETALEAAQEYVDDGDWNPIESTSWITVYVQQIGPDGEEIGERNVHTIAIEPQEPDCSHDDGHDWQSPYEVLGGLKENPGVWGKGGGVVVTEVCAHCGQYRITDSWAQNRETGEQGLTSTEYEAADEKSEAWVRSNSAAERMLALVAGHDEDAVNRAIQEHLGDEEACVDMNDGEVYSGEWIRGEALAGIVEAIEDEIK